MARKMGLGKLGDRNLTIKRKFRYTFTVEGPCFGTIPEHFVKVASRPNITIDELEINFLNAKDWVPGKASWETITVTYMDVASADIQPLYNWLASVYDFASTDENVNSRMGSKRADYSGIATITLYDGCGNSLEQWVLGNAWPQAINFGELDNSSSEDATIELTLRYSQVTFKHLCPTFTPEGCCTGCTAV